MMFALRQMMSLTLMMFPTEMMSASPNVIGKHRIIANEMGNIIFAKQMHHIAFGDASFETDFDKKLGVFRLLSFLSDT